MGFKSEIFSLFGITVSCDEPMDKHTGYAVGGKADYYVTCYNLKGVVEIIELCNYYKMDYLFIGNGSNIVISDQGYRGVIISLKGLNSIWHDNGIVIAMSGVSLCDLVLFSAEYSLFGGEALIGIPATVGGAVTMNAGAFNTNISDFVKEVQTIKDGKIVYYRNDECDFTYRHSRFLLNKEPIVCVKFKFNKQNNSSSHKKLINVCREKRRTNQPQGRSCGCVFRNPEGDYAGKIIDNLGLKGLRLGTAEVSCKHANFILADKLAP